MVDFLFVDDPTIDEASWAKAMTPTWAAPLLDDVIAAYETCAVGRRRAEGRVDGDRRARSTSSSGKARRPVRVAVTGRIVGPPLFESLELLGRDETLRRLRRPDAAGGLRRDVSSMTRLPTRDDTPVALDPADRRRPAPRRARAGRRAGGRRRSRRARRRAGVARCSSSVVVLLRASACTRCGRPGGSDQARPVDAIVVMGAAQYDGAPSPQLAARLDHVVELWPQGLAPLVVVTGGNQPGDRFTEAEASAAYLAERGVPADAIVLEDQGTTQLRVAAGRRRGCSTSAGSTTVLIVTDPYHALRSRLIAEEVGLRGPRLADADERRHRRRAVGPRSCRRPPASPSAGSSASTASDPTRVSGTRGFRAGRMPDPRIGPACGHAATLPDRSGGEWCNRQHSRFWFCY